MPTQAEADRSAPAEVDAAFAEDVRSGLGHRPKRLSCRFLYDAEGSRLFEAICALPDYYLTGAEREILDARAREIVARLDPETSLIELGSGSAAKTSHLIDAFLAVHGRARYVPIDISPEALQACCARLARTRPELELHPIAAEYQAGLEVAAVTERGHHKLVLWLGSSVGNFHPADARAFLQSLQGLVSLEDLLLVGIDLRKRRDVLERAYDDAAGVTARFNLNLLARINRELGGEFDLDRFEHRAVYDVLSGCVSMHLVSRGAQRVRIAALDLDVPFLDGEGIHTESSYKYSPAEIDALAREAGFAIERRWRDARGRFSLNLLAPARH